MFYVYLLRSETHLPSRKFGATADLSARHPIYWRLARQIIDLRESRCPPWPQLDEQDLCLTYKVVLRCPNSSPASEGGLYPLRLYPPEQEQSRPVLHWLNQRSAKTPRRTQRRKIHPHKQIQALGPEDLRRAPRKTSRGRIREISEERLRPRFCEEPLAGRKRKKSLMVRPSSVRREQSGSHALENRQNFNTFNSPGHPSQSHPFPLRPNIRVSFT